MDNKVLIRLIVPELDNIYDVFIPVNELIWKSVKLMIKSISDLSGVELDINRPYVLLNKQTGNTYENNEIILNTDIRNATELVLLSSK